MLNKTQLEKIFAREAVLVGDMDVIPLRRAMELFGVDAVEFAVGSHDGRMYNAYGIGDYELFYLTPMGVRKAVTYNNIMEMQKTKKPGLKNTERHKEANAVVDFRARVSAK